MPSDIIAALEKAREGSAGDTETVRFPLSMGPLRPDQDHTGDACSVIDVVFNSDVLREASAFRCSAEKILFAVSVRLHQPTGIHVVYNMMLSGSWTCHPDGALRTVLHDHFMLFRQALQQKFLIIRLVMLLCTQWPGGD